MNKSIALTLLGCALFFLFVSPAHADDNCTNDLVTVFNVNKLSDSENLIAELDLSKVDVLVPGTASENGCIKHLNTLIDAEANRTYIALNYFDPGLRFWGIKKQTRQERGNAVKYDDSVKFGSEGLIALLDILKQHSPNSVRVFGHSKGSHIVSYVSTQYDNPDDHRWVKFWAFAQPGRTDKTPNYEGIVGYPGYIHKVSDNLVTVTWANDEVIHFTKDARPPNAWKYPGKVNSPGQMGTKDYMRIDHHNTYLGDFTSDTCPYFVTGNDSLYNAKSTHLGSSKSRGGCNFYDSVETKAHFWSDDICKALAVSANRAGREVGWHHEIGNSGPRGENCSEHPPIPIEFKMEYFISAKNNNIAGFHVRFRAYEGSANNRHESANLAKLGSYRRESNIKKVFGVTTKRENRQTDWIETPWITKTLPLSFRVQIDPMHSSVNGKRNNRIHISWLKARFTLPDETERRTVYLIGPQWRNDGFTHFEGEAEHGNLAGSRHGGWNYMPDERGNWKLFKSSKLDLGSSIEPRNTLKLVGNGEDKTRGVYKLVSLVD